VSHGNSGARHWLLLVSIVAIGDSGNDDVGTEGWCTDTISTVTSRHGTESFAICCRADFMRLFSRLSSFFFCVAALEVDASAEAESWLLLLLLFLDALLAAAAAADLEA
jgi:hypothetical protein